MIIFQPDILSNWHFLVELNLMIIMFIPWHQWWPLNQTKIGNWLQRWFVYSGACLYWASHVFWMSWLEKNGVPVYHRFSEEHSEAFEFWVFPSPRQVALPRLESWNHTWPQIKHLIKTFVEFSTALSYCSWMKLYYSYILYSVNSYMNTYIHHILYLKTIFCIICIQ